MSDSYERARIDALRDTTEDELRATITTLTSQRDMLVKALEAFMAFTKRGEGDVLEIEAQAEAALSQTKEGV